MTVSLKYALLAGACLIGLQTRAASAAPIDNLRLPSGQFLTPTAAPGAAFLPLNPGLATHPNFLAGRG